MTILRTHTGFLAVSPANGSPVHQFYGNPAIRTLYLDMINDPTFTDTWEWRRQAIGIANEILNNNPNFFNLQIFGNVPMPSRNVDFIHSVLTFIMTGKRQLPTILWNDVLEFHPTNLTVVSDKTRDHFKDLFGMVIDSPVHLMLSMWLSQPRGLEDMLTSLFIIFGDLPENWQNT